ncbi:hypothetical protein [Acanthopleuribacter pedis]|uniref:Uncharacterized protein n=1 Tax=Acanthopleuribacter pedis TaxID=442870 RepID=A0A8J7U7K1_9BACT|nr:hypothetical protein [Acanthopleuribacter pedis]MBO1322603.1 hypothetical protein [Acanthopleuribacter pedis]
MTDSSTQTTWIEQLWHLQTRDSPMGAADVAAFRTATGGGDPDALDAAFLAQHPEALVTPSGLLTFPALAEARVAVSRGVPMVREWIGASGTYYVYDRAGNTEAPPLGVFKPETEDYQPDPDDLTAIRADPKLHPMRDRVAAWFPDSEAEMLQRMVDEDRYFYLSAPLGTGPAKEVIASAIGAAVGVPHTVMTEFNGVRGSFQSYVRDLKRLNQRPDLWQPAFRLLAHRARLQTIGAFIGVLGQEDTWEIYAAGKGPNPDLITLDHNKCFTDLLVRFQRQTLSLMFSETRELRQTLGWLFTLPLAEAPRAWSLDTDAVPRFESGNYPDSGLAEMRLAGKLWHACRDRDLPIWDFLQLRDRPLTQWFAERGDPDADPSMLAEERAAQRATWPQPHCGPCSDGFTAHVSAFLQKAVNPKPSDINPWFVEDLGLHPLTLPAGTLDGARFPGQRIFCETEPDPSWTRTALNGLKSFCSQVFGDEKADQALTDLSHLISVWWMEALASANAAKHGVALWPDGRPAQLIAEESRPDDLHFELSGTAGRAALQIAFTRHLAALTDADEHNNLATEPRASRFHLSLKITLNYGGDGRAFLALNAAEAAFGFAPLETREELYLW